MRASVVAILALGVALASVPTVVVADDAVQITTDPSVDGIKA